MTLDGPAIWMIVLFTLLIMGMSLLLAPPTFLSDLFDGDRKRKKKRDWTEDGD
ncbi:MAG: hypothetical protein U5J83_13105 [Bryobacterales bacterium]|nr:hypothetical protein [Bryobacterales bacterium]